jgi:hypothetical protein
MNEKPNNSDEMLDEYDFSKGIRGKYIERARSTRVVRLEPDVAEVFTDSESVNQALRGLLPIINERVEKSHRP